MSSDISIRVLGAGFVEFTFTVVAEAHLCLAESNGVLALADAIKLFEFFLVNTLQNRQRKIHSQHFEPIKSWVLKVSSYLGREVNFDGLDADIGWSKAHIE
jgi:hypothetical protein